MLMIIKNSRCLALSTYLLFTTAMKVSVPALYVLEYRFLNYKCLFSNIVHIFC